MNLLRKITMRKANKTYNNYIDYLKDNPEGYWFKRKLYGWGWVPAKWQGWLTTFIFIIALVFIVQNIAVHHNTGPANMYWIAFVILLVILIMIGYKKGEKPKWSWGFRRN